MGTRRGRGGTEPPGDDDDPFDDLLRPGFSGGAALHEPSAEERARAAREANLVRRLAEEEEHQRRLAKRTRRIRRKARPRQLLRLVVPALAVVFVAGMAWVQYRDGGGPSGSAAERASRPSNYPPVDKSASPDPLGRPPPIPQPAGAFQFSLTQGVGTGPVAWDPCRPIRYVVNSAGAPEGGDQLIRSAVASASAGTGLVFVDEGVTDEVWSKDREPYQPERYGERWAPALIAWSSSSAVPGLGGYIAGLGGGTAAPDLDGRLAYVSGALVLDAEDITAILAQRDGIVRAQAVVQHELGHVIGLAHVADQAQLMYSEGAEARDWGAGDLAGLHQLGSGACFPDL